MEINTVNLVGRAGREPDVKYFESGSIVANFTLAVNRRSRDEEPDWFNLEIWGKQAQIAADYVKNGIRCNAILPGTVETPSWESRVNMADNPKKAREDFIARQPMGRLAQAEEIASLATYLASDESDFVTGTLNLIDGGWTL